MRQIEAVSYEISLGATYQGNGRCRFRIWAPFRREVDVTLLAPRKEPLHLEKEKGGYFVGLAEDIHPGTLYLVRLDGALERPDPASRFQPSGVHGPSQVTDPAFPWGDEAWKGLALEDYVVYELHPGAFTPEGTFDAIIPRLRKLKDLGITAVELMPVNQFPGSRNWGYDGVYPYAVQNTYGGPGGLKRLVDAAHCLGLAVILDVVYNHLGPEGNYLRDFGPYFTDRYRTPWGEAINFDGPYSDEVRRYFIENALYWITEFHFDALRLDALHAILDISPRPFLAELSAAVRRAGEKLERRVHLMAESDLNDARFLRPESAGGYGLDVHWNDDFHHALHALLTGEQAGYYRDYGRVEDLAKAYREGLVYSGQYSIYRKRRHGSSTREFPPRRLLVFAQNHDQVGNRMGGERLSRLVSFERLKLAAAAVLLSPFIPLLFMGEEYGEPAPFLYFVDHGNPDLIEAVRRGRKEEFNRFHWGEDPPDPQAEDTFTRSRIHFSLAEAGDHRVLWEFHQELIQIRREIMGRRNPEQGIMEAVALKEEKVLVLRDGRGNSGTLVILHFGWEARMWEWPGPPGKWRKRLASGDQRWRGPGDSSPDVFPKERGVVLPLPPTSCLVYLKGENE
jgi:maltooligosyltrehalose trehalohydrolase